MDVNFLIAQSIQKETLASAERERLIRQIVKARRPARVPSNWMARLGDQMIVLGQDLKARSARA